MPFYQDLFFGLKKDEKLSPEKKRTVQNLLSLREDLRKNIPERSSSKTLLLATWNIRDFDRKAYGNRLDESIYYIAEIISKFDIIAIQEVYKDLKGLKRVMEILGSDWDYIFTDVTEGEQGNDECMAYVFDKRKVRFGGLAGELVMPPNSDGTASNQIWRTPFICGFQAGWAKFMICSVHIQWGKDNSIAPADRVEEVRRVADFLKKRTEDENAWARKLILVGDFNIIKRSDKIFKPLKDAGFEIPDLLKNTNTNAKLDMQYDQIVFRQRENSLIFLNGGAYNYYNTVFKAEDEAIYAEYMGESYIKNEKGVVKNAKQKSEYYSTYWKTHQMSDHLPLWVEFEIDFSDAYLKENLAKLG